MTGPVFVDTNVLVYARDASEPVKQPLALQWLEELWRTRRGRVSQQVLNEYYVTVTRKLRPGLTPDAARRDVRALAAWRPAQSDMALAERAFALQDRHGFSYWDALVVAAALEQECELLLSEDFQAGLRIEGLTVVNPFVISPA